ncbi:MAG TPA: hypothetical protein VJ302_10605 [Blastocatellia bacterium]|nr:hypothetical protein [Blastocatellia bacterium]
MMKITERGRSVPAAAPKAHDAQDNITITGKVGGDVVSGDKTQTQGDKSVIVETNQGTIKTGDEIHHHHSSAGDIQSILEKISLQNEITFLDRQWENECKKYLIRLDSTDHPILTTKWGRAILTLTICMSIVIGLATTLCLLIFYDKDIGSILIPCYLLALTLVALGILCYKIAKEYEAKYVVYQKQRKALVARLSSAKR